MPDHVALMFDALRAWIDGNRPVAVFAAGVFLQTLLLIANVLFLSRAAREAEALRAAVDGFAMQLASADDARRSKMEERRRILSALSDGLAARPTAPREPAAIRRGSGA
jgi:hypothetical protein